MMTMQDRAMLAAREVIVARWLVTREELMQWNVSARLNSRKTFFTVLFKNASNSRRIECEVLNRLDPVADGGVKLSVKITIIVACESSTVPKDPWADVFFDADKPRRTHVRHLLRRCVAA